MKRRTAPPKSAWAYDYQIVPPQPEDRMREVRALIAAERATLPPAPRLWQLRLVQKELATHILVVSDSPDQEREDNRRLESALERLGIPYLRTVPLPVAG